MTKFKIIRIVVYTILFGYICYLTTPYSQSEIVPEVQPLYSEFITLVKANCKDDQYFHPQFKISFKELEGDVIGMCYTYPKSFKIYLDTKFWKYSEENDRRQLLFHELLHCHFLLDHVSDPHNIMYYMFNKLTRDEIFDQTLKHIKSQCL